MDKAGRNRTATINFYKSRFGYHRNIPMLGTNEVFGQDSVDCIPAPWHCVCVCALIEPIAWLMTVLSLASFWDALKSKVAHFFYVKTLVSVFTSSLHTWLTILFYRGSMGVSPDGKVLVVSNLNTGFDFYHLDNSRQDGSVSHPCTGLRVPVEFIHRGNAVLGGRTTGEVHIWDCVSRTRLQVLGHAGRLICY
jgi:hypothetical protein